jgi:hypothetical protein
MGKEMPLKFLLKTPPKEKTISETYSQMRQQY